MYRLLLVLEYVISSELLAMENLDEQHALPSKSLLHQIWRELVSEVEEMLRASSSIITSSLRS